MARKNRKSSSRAPVVAIPHPAPIDLPQSFYFGALIALLVVAAGLRLWAARGELWLDEIWSLMEFARTAKSPADVFRFHHDNNHYLTTLWMYLLGPEREPWILFRLPSLATGIGTVALLPVAARRWGSLASVVAALLGALSLLLIQYASEARGYAPAGFFALVMFVTLDRYLQKPTRWAGVGFVSASILGVLSHLTTIEISLAAVLWSAVHFWRQPGPRAVFLRRMLALHSLPVLFIAALYVVDIRAMTIGGGKAEGLARVMTEALALAIGAPTLPLAGAVAAAVVTVLIAALGLVWLARDQDDAWVFFASAIFVAPAVALVAQRSTTLFERYFYLNILFFLLLLAFVLSRAALLGRAGRVAVAVMIVLYLLGNVSQTAGLLRLGRGHFIDVLQYLTDHSVNPRVHIYNEGRRTRAVMYTQFYARQIKNPDFVFDRWVPNMPQPPEWHITTSREHDNSPGNRVTWPGSPDVYLLERVFPYGGLSGFQFALYHREADLRRAAEQESQRSEPAEP